MLSSNKTWAQIESGVYVRFEFADEQQFQDQTLQLFLFPDTAVGGI